MDLTNLLKEENILLPLDVQTKEECIDKMADSMAKAGFITDKMSYVETVLNREKTGSTGIGFGVAIPHGKFRGVATPGIAFARLSQPVEWQSLDGNPVSGVFLIAVPEENAGNEHLQILIAISRKLMHENFRNQLLTAQSPKEVLGILQNL